jgi:phospholipid/cholesterol/gamma-HCH transport system ATP-binding protein
MIQIRGLFKNFAANKVLQGLDLDIETGKTTTIIGGSGSGKSVLFKHIIGPMPVPSWWMERTPCG